MRLRPVMRLAAVGAAVGWASLVGVTAPATRSASAPKSNLEYWLSRGEATSASAGSQPAATGEANPFAGDRTARDDALPGVIVLSDGRLIAGLLFTTRDKDWEVWVGSEKRWRHIPPILVLGLSAVVVEETMEPEWRWKEMGSDEKIYTGRKRPFRRFEWRFHLIDDSVIAGAVKGQPLYVQTPDNRRGLYVLHERSDGQYGQTLQDLVYVKRAVISRRAMEEVGTRPATTPAPQ